MNEFLTAVKSDLSDRRLLPLVGIVALLLIAALGYALFGGGSSTPTASVEPAPVSQGAGALLVTPAQASPTVAVAETTSGSAAQHHGHVHDPFNLLPGSVQPATTSKASSATSSASSSSSSGSGGSGGGTSSASSGGGGASGGESSPSPTPSKGTQPKRRVLYEVKLMFGELPPGTTSATAQLKSYTLRKPTPLPNAKEKRITLDAVSITKNGKGALFALNGEVILHGPGTCLPSSTQCEVLKLQEGDAEQLEFLPANGGPSVTYEVRVVSVSPIAVAAKAAARIAAATAHTAAKLVAAKTGPLRYSALRYSADISAFVPGHAAFGARSN